MNDTIAVDDGMKQLVDALITKRHATHGDYANTAETAQQIKDAYRERPEWHSLDDQVRESLDMIATKTARIISGDQFFIDHWEDIMG